VVWRREIKSDYIFPIYGDFVSEKFKPRHFTKPNCGESGDRFEICGDVKPVEPTEKVNRGQEAKNGNQKRKKGNRFRGRFWEIQRAELSNSSVLQPRIWAGSKWKFNPGFFKGHFLSKNQAIATKDFKSITSVPIGKFRREKGFVEILFGLNKCFQVLKIKVKMSEIHEHRSKSLV
jgi:hypothetical protein